MFHHYILISFTSGRKVASLLQEALNQEDLYRPIATKRKIEETVQRMDLGTKTEGYLSQIQYKRTFIGQKLE